MQIKAIVWDKVMVTCPSDSKKNAVHEEATVALDGVRKLLSIRGTTGSSPKTAMYAKASLVELTVNGAKFEACWWSTRFLKDGTAKHSKDVLVEVVCEL